MTKKDKVLEHLKKYNTITSLEAIDKFGYGGLYGTFK